MASEVGIASLYIALLVSFGIIFYKLWFWMNRRHCSHSVILILWIIKLLAIFGAFISLIYCFATSDFSVVTVLKNSHTSNPLIYKISASWGNHEGSMLLWVLSVAFFSTLFGLTANRNFAFVQGTMIIQAVLMACFLLFIIFVSNPFLRVYPYPSNGFGFNPILQDIGLAFHPPMLYLGYVGFSISYSAAIAGLFYKQVNEKWAQEIRPYVLLSWSFLTAGIALGSWWAYRELGWGGFWFWDPVENASLMPWLLACALIHSLLILERYGAYKSWCYILGALTFIMSVIGTFIVRSGLITSVHSFASDPTRGLFILVFLAALMGGALILYILQNAEDEAYMFKIDSVQGFIYGNNLLLCTAAFTVAIGTLCPKIIELVRGDLISVGAGYFNHLFSPLSILAAALCAMATCAVYKKQHKVRMVVIGISVIASILSFIHDDKNITYMLLILSGAILLISQVRRFAMGNTSAIAHFGIGLLMMSIGFNSLFQKSLEKNIYVGDDFQLSEYIVTLTDLNVVKEKNYLARKAVFFLKKNEKHIATLMPETRFFPVERQQTTESAIYSTIFEDIYLSVGQVYNDGSISVRCYIKPMIWGIWVSGVLIFISSFVSAFEAIKRKYKDVSRARL